MRRAIGIIGFGNMGSAIAESLKNKYKIYVFDKERYKTQSVSGLVLSRDILDLANKVDTLILAVKPQDCAEVLEKLKEVKREKLIVSIAAGIPTSYIEKRLSRVKVIRVMPNILAKINQSVTCLCRGASTDENDLAFVEGLFSELGKTLKIKEEMMDAATAVSGSGPAYVCDYIESNAIVPNAFPEEKKLFFLNEFKNAAEAVGFSSDEADFLVKQTFQGTIDFLRKIAVSAAELKQRVASKGGTTEAALAVLRSGGSLTETVAAATKRAQELAKKE